MTQVSDIVAVGSGHNGLIAAAYCAKAGKKVTVLERNNWFGGGCVSRELTVPGFTHDQHSMSHIFIQANPLLKNDELGLLSKYGLKYVYPDSPMYSVFEDGTTLGQYRDRNRTAADIAKFSTKDSDAYLKLAAKAAELLPMFVSQLFVPPMPNGAISAMMDQSREGRELGRLLQMSSHDLLCDTFEHDKVRMHFARVAGEALVSPDEKATAIGIFVFVGFMEATGIGVPVGGSGQLTRALIDCIRDHGGEVLSDVDVTKVRTSNGRATFVVAADGREWQAREAVIGAFHPHVLGDIVEGVDPYVEGTYGSFNRVSVKAASNFTLVPDRLYARFTGMARHVAGYMKRYDYGCVTGRNAPGGNFAPGAGNCKIGTEGGQEVYAVRGALRWIASDRIEDNLVVDFTQDRSEASPAKLLLQHDFGNGNNYITGPKDYTSYANYTGHPGTADQFTVPAISHLKSWGIANTLDVRLNESLSLKSITAFRKSSGQNAWDGDASPESVFNNFNVFTHKQFTQELRLSTSLGSLVDATLGGYYYDADSTLGGRIDVEAAGLEFAFDDPFKQTSKSGFLHVVVHPSSRLNITGGIRYTKEDKDYTFTRYSPIPGQPTSPFVAPLDGVQRSFSGSRWDYRIAIDYEIADDIRPYAQVATGFKGGGINPRPFFVSQAVTFGQEKVTSYEIGLKTMLLDRRLRLNGAIYQTDYKDYQAQLLFCPDLSPPGLGNNCAATQNVADAKIQGFEIEGEFQPVDGLSIDGSVSYVDFKFRNIDPASGLTANTRPQFSPKWKYAIGAQYRADLGGHGSLTPRLDWAYRSSIESNAINNTPGFMMGHVNAVGLLNARLTYRSPDEDWEASLAVTNVTDKFYYINKYDREAGFNTVFGQPGRPREWMVSIKRKF